MVKAVLPKHICTSGLFYNNQKDEFICQWRGVWLNLFTFLYFFMLRRKTHLSYANNVVSDQMPPVAASDLGLHYLHMSYFIWDVMG